MLAVDLAYSGCVLLRGIVTPVVRFLVVELYTGQVFVEKLLVASDDSWVSLLQIDSFLAHWVLY